MLETDRVMLETDRVLLETDRVALYIIPIPLVYGQTTAYTSPTRIPSVVSHTIHRPVSNMDITVQLDANTWTSFTFQQLYKCILMDIRNDVIRTCPTHPPVGAS